MFGIVLCASLLLAGQRGDGEVGGEMPGRCRFTSTPALNSGHGMLALVLTETVTNSKTDELAFTLMGGERGIIPSAVQRTTDVAPRSVTMVRTSYRLAQEADDELSGKYVDGHAIGFAVSRWKESGPVGRASSRASLEAKLIDGDAKGKVLVRCLCAVTANKGGGGYLYAYTVESLTDQPLKFKWAGLEGEVGPKRDFVKVEPSKELTVETQGLATLDFGDGKEYAIRANFWARPK